MLLENSLKKYKETPEAIKQMVGLAGLTATIIFTFIILNVFFGGEIKESDKTAESVNTTEIDKVIISLPRGRLNFYESSEGHQLSPSEYEVVCKNTKIVTQRAMMGANIVNFSATKLYFDNGNKIDERSVKWDSSSNKCFAEYTIRAIEGVSDTITVSGEAKGFFKTSLDTRVYFIKNY
jgi:cell division protein FtsI/penicillin-binding protein 2